MNRLVTMLISLNTHNTDGHVPKAIAAQCPVPAASLFYQINYRIRCATRHLFLSITRNEGILKEVFFFPPCSFGRQGESLLTCKAVNRFFVFLEALERWCVHEVINPACTARLAPGDKALSNNGKLRETEGICNSSTSQMRCIQTRWLHE